MPTLPYSTKKMDLPEEWSAWKKDPSEQNLDSLLNKFTPTIDKAVEAYGSGKKSLIPKAKMMAVDAFGTYDPKKGMSLNSYLHQQLQSLNREKARRANTVHVPENVILQKNKLYQASKTFESENGREPNILELADMTGIPRHAIERAKTYRDTAPSSLSQTESGDDIRGKVRDFDQVWTDYVYFDLDPTDKKIFEMVTGYGGTAIYPKGEIARKLKISPAAVSQRINRIVGMMEQAPSGS